MKILNFGSCNIDYVYKLDHIVAVGETELSRSMSVFPGGKGLNQSIATARAGASVYHAGCIGAEGELLLDTMSESGVDLRYIKRVEEKNGHAIIQVSEKGENSIFLYAGSNAMITEDFVDFVIGEFEKGDVIVLQNEINNMDYIINSAYKKGMTIVLNPSPIDEKIAGLDYNMISYVVLNEIEGEHISGQKVPEKIISVLKNKYPSLKVVLTLGDKGCMYYDGKDIYHHPAYEVEAVDTTAAGDTFMGYFVACLVSGEESYKSIEKASLASAIAVSRNGAAPSIPYCEEVERARAVYKKKTDKTESREALIKAKIDAYIDENIQSAALSGLAGELGYSSAYTGELVKKLTSKSFGNYLREKRCDAASRLLKSTEMPIGDIIRQVGYNNESFFRGIFAELYGTTPYNYRKTMKNRG